jgi:hypothetical protein
MKIVFLTFNRVPTGAYLLDGESPSLPISSFRQEVFSLNIDGDFQSFLRKHKKGNL